MGGLQIIRSCSRTPQGRIRKVESAVLDSTTPMVYFPEPEGGSTFWIRPGGLVLVSELNQDPVIPLASHAAAFANTAREAKGQGPVGM